MIHRGRASAVQHAVGDDRAEQRLRQGYRQYSKAVGRMYIAGATTSGPHDGESLFVDDHPTPVKRHSEAAMISSWAKNACVSATLAGFGENPVHRDSVSGKEEQREG